MSPTAKITSRQGPVVSATDGKVNGKLTKFDGALMINRGNRLLILFENPRRAKQARNFTTNVLKILDLKSSSEQIFSLAVGV